MSTEDLNKIFIAGPIFLAFLLEIFVPYLHTLECNKVWYSPPLKLNIILYLASMILLGFLLYETSEISNNKNSQIFSYCVLLTLLTIASVYYIFRNNKLTIVLLLLAVAFSAFTHNTIFLSHLVDDDNALYLNLVSIYIIWLGLLLSVTYQVEEKRLSGNKEIKLNKIKSNKKEKSYRN